MDEVLARYPGQWVLWEVTDNEDGWPSAGWVIAHDQSHSRMCDVRIAQVEPAKLRGPLHLFEAVRYLRTGEEIRQALAQLEEEDGEDLDASRWPRG